MALELGRLGCLTGMANDERGIAVAMSLGGKAGRLARGIPHGYLEYPNVLAYLIRQLEREFGTEVQDRVRHALRPFLQYRRPKGCSAMDHVNTFEHLLSDAELHGLRTALRRRRCCWSR